MRARRSPTIPGLAIAGLALCLAAGFPGSAAAQPAARSIKTEAEFVSYNAAAQTVTVKVIKPGIGKEAKSLKAGQQSDFKVKPEGSALSKTHVAILGVKGELTSIQPGKTVNVYWRPDEVDPSARFARKIDVILSDEELDQRYGTE